MRRLISALAVAGLLVGLLAGPASAASQGRTVYAHINGGGNAIMTDLPDGLNRTHWGTGVTLYSDGTASGQFDCVDQHGDVPGYPGNIWGEATSWYIDGDGFIAIVVVGKLVNIPGHGVGDIPPPGGHPVDVTFTVRIQQFGGAGVGHWTLEVEVAPGVVIVFCHELLTSGQIAIKYA
jgi:hypothetical protein